MPSRALTRLLCRIALTLALATPAVLLAAADEPGELQPYNAPITESSISGISSGGFMAVQFGTAWSSIIKGVGIVAGGPYYCAQASAADIWTGYTMPILIATGPCMKGPAPDVQVSVHKADEKAAADAIDPTSNLGRQKVYLFHGFNDAVVAQSVTDATLEFYRHYQGPDGAGNLFYQTTLGAGHAQVLGKEQLSGPNACPINNTPYINECGYDQAGVILQHIYGALNPPASGELSGTMKSFSQAKYTAPDEPAALSMGDNGFVYVPKDCESEQGPACRIHIALHGCQQDLGDIGKLYVDDAGYNAWADTNRIIVLYPQTIARPELGLPPQNPQACWDWWSYITHDDDYVTKSGRQIKAIKAMLDALTAGQKTLPDAAPAASPRLLVIDISDSSADLAWTPVAGAESYSIWRAEGDEPFAPVGKASGLSYADDGLKASTSYRWGVTAMAGGQEEMVLQVAAKTLPKTVPCDNPGNCPLTRTESQ